MDPGAGAAFTQVRNQESTLRQRVRLLARRLLAYMVDYGVILVYLLLLFAASWALALSTRAAEVFQDPWLAQGVGFVTLTLPVALFLAAFETSRGMATPGKRVLGLSVSDLEGRRLGFGRALLRALAKLFPWELAHFFIWRTPRDPGPTEAFPVWVMLGYWLVLLLVAVYLALPLVTRKGQSLHDLVAGTVVRRGGPHRANHGHASIP
jgi:uncharacterized RDD family membrane protein YckC